MSVSESKPEEFNDQEFQESISNLENSLQLLKQRYNQVSQDQAKKEQLLARKQELKAKGTNNSNREPIKTELSYLEQELQELEVRLESNLFRWTTLSEPFWQAVRFGGIGVVIGWILKSCSG